MWDGGKGVDSVFSLWGQLGHGGRESVGAEIVKAGGFQCFTIPLGVSEICFSCDSLLFIIHTE